MKKVLVFYVLVCVSALVSLAFAGQPDMPKDEIVMKYGAKPVTFSHSVHKGYSCVECHHVAGEKAFLPCSTEGCHDSKDRKVKGSYYQVMHARKGTAFSTCVSCHNSLSVDAQRKKELVACTGACHPKE